MLTIASDMNDVTGTIAVVGGLVIGMIAVIGGMMRSAYTTRQREQSRREIAAYIAEGSMTPDEGARLLDAGLPSWERGKTRIEQRV